MIRKKLSALALLFIFVLTLLATGLLSVQSAEGNGMIALRQRFLSELAVPGKTVCVDGVELQSLAVNGEDYIRLDQLQSALPWLTMTEEETQCIFHLRDSDEPVLFSRCTVKQFRNHEAPEHCCIDSDNTCYLPAESFCEKSGLHTMSDEEALYISGVVMNGSKLPENASIPVLMYHSFSDDVWGDEELFVSADVFREQMQYLLSAGYQPIFFEDLYHLQDYSKPVLITVDDGYLDNYEKLFPVLKELNVKVTLNLITGNVDTDTYGGFMSSQQIKEMSDSGLVSVQSHTVTHAKLDQADEETHRYEMSESRKMITKWTGKIPYLLSCPESRSCDLTYQIVPDYYMFMTDYGYATGLTWPVDVGAFHVNRTSIHRSISLDEFKEMYP